jgi:hypothetical protein
LRALLIAVAVAACSAAVPPPDAAQVRAAAASVTKTLAVQTRLPNSSGTPAPSSRNEPRGWRLFGPEGGMIPASQSVLSLLEWTGITIAAIAALALLAMFFREPGESRFRPIPLAGPPPSSQPPLADPRELLALADRLAAEARFAEAMHYLLLAAMAVLARAVTAKSADSLTSWELLRQATLVPPQLPPLRNLVAAAERAWFGGRPAAESDYQMARANFDAFRAAGTETA